MMDKAEGVAPSATADNVRVRARKTFADGRRLWRAGMEYVVPAAIAEGWERAGLVERINGVCDSGATQRISRRRKHG